MSETLNEEFDEDFVFPEIDTSHPLLSEGHPGEEDDDPEDES